MKSRILFWSIPLLLFILNSNRTTAQEVSFNKVISPDDNFGGCVAGIAQDRNGYIWISSHNGLFKYDGYRFKHYLHDPNNPNSLSASALDVICVASDDNIWIGFLGEGLDRLDPNTGILTHFRNNPDDPSTFGTDPVRTILEDHLGNIWIGTVGGLDCFDHKTGKFIHYRYHADDSTSLSNNYVRILYEDRDGTLWVGTGDLFDDYGRHPDEGGLNRLERNTGKFKRFKHDPKNPHSLISNIVHSIFEDSKGVFWVGTAGDGLHSMDRARGTFQRYPYDPAHPERLSRPPIGRPAYTGISDRITTINEDAFGSIWIGTLYNGLNRYDRKMKRVIHYGAKDSTSDLTILRPWVICNSRDGVMWIGTIDGSLFRVNLFFQKIPHIDVDDGVYSFMEDHANVFWIGTFNEGLIRKDMNTAITKVFSYDPLNPRSLSGNKVYSIYKDLSGVMWIGTDSGLNRLNKNDISFTRYKNNPKDINTLSAGRIWAITGNGRDSIWIGTNGNGLDLMDTKTGSITHFRNEPKDTNSLSCDEVNVLKIDHAGNLWVGSGSGSAEDGGINYLDTKAKTFKHFLKGEYINSIYEDSDSIFWVGTYHGLYRSNKKDPISGFIDFDNLGNKIKISDAYSIQEDSQKNLWVNTVLGIYRIDLRNFKTIYRRADHAENGPDLRPLISSYKRENGEIYLGDEKGYFVFSPDKFRANLQPPKIIFTDLRIGGQSLIANANGPLTVPIELAKEITLKYNQNSFDIDFAGINYSNPESNRHEIMMQNYDTTWRVKGEKTVYYFNLPPGEYVFHVRAATSDGIWAERDLKITITPPWWRTWWAYTFYGICILAGIYFTDRIRRKVVIGKERAKTRERELVQAKEIEKAYTELKTTQSQLIQSEKMASLGELTAGIAHEIQNPLNFVNNFSEVNRELLAEMHEEISKGNYDAVKSLARDLSGNEEKISHHGKRADTIVKSMLQHSKSGTGKKEPTDLNALTDEYLSLAYHGIRAKDSSFNASMKTDFDKSIGNISIVPQEIGRVLLNLYNNAFYAIMEKQKKQPEASASVPPQAGLAKEAYVPTISVRTKKIENKVEIRIRDNGNGVPHMVKEKIFQPFFTTKPTGLGTGLGLSLSYDIIKAHGGDIKVETKPGEGAEFVIDIPAVCGLL
jgi:ligand-binding sensor domain-containing protein/signal transduction histidine kinase